MTPEGAARAQAPSADRLLAAVNTAGARLRGGGGAMRTCACIRSKSPFIRNGTRPVSIS